MEDLDIFIEKEKQKNPGLKELIEVFFSAKDDTTRDNMFQKDVTTLVENIKINEDDIKDIHIKH